MDETHCMREQFLGFLPFKRGLSGDAMVTTVIDFLRYQNVEIDDCRGQGYDRAGNTAGRLSGAAARIQENYKKALYVHCNCHILHFCIATCCKEQFVSNMMEYVHVTSEFFNISPKCFNLLVKTIEEICSTSSH